MTNHTHKASKTREFNAGGRKGQRMPKPAIQQITTEPFEIPANVKVDGVWQKIPQSVRLVATSRTKVIPGKGPGKGPASVLWDVNIVNMRTNQIDAYPQWQGIAHPQMRWLLLQTQLLAMGRDRANPSDVTKDDLHFAHEQAKNLPGNNVLNRLQRAKPQNVPAASRQTRVSIVTL